MVELETSGLVAPGNRFEEQPTRFHHAQGYQAIQHGKRLFADDALQRFRPSSRRAGGQVMGQGVTEQAGRFPARVVQGRQLGQLDDLSRCRIHAVFMLQLPGTLFGEERPGITDKPLQTGTSAVDQKPYALILYVNAYLNLAIERQLVSQGLQRLNQDIQLAGVRDRGRNRYGA